MRLINLIIYFVFSFFQAFTQDYYPEEANKRSRRAHREPIIGELYNEGLKLLQRGNYSAAIPYFDTVLEEKPTFSDAYFARAQAKEQTNDLIGALVDYETVSKLDEKHTEANFNKAIAYFKLKNYEQAIKAFDDILANPSGETNAVYFRGVKHQGSSEVAFDQIISMYTKDAEVLNYRGLAKMQLGDLDGALADFDRAIKISATEPHLFVNRGIVKGKMDNKEGAIQDFKEALKIDPLNQLANYNLALATKDLDNAEYKEAQERAVVNADFPNGYLSRAFDAFESGDYDSAIEDYTAALNLAPENYDAWYNRGLAKEKSGDLEGAVKDFSKAININSESWKAYSSRAGVYFKLKDFQSAKADYDKTLEINKNGSSYYNRGLTLYKLKQSDLACEDIQKAVKMGVEDVNNVLEKCAEVK